MGRSVTYNWHIMKQKTEREIAISNIQFLSEKRKNTPDQETKDKLTSAIVFYQNKLKERDKKLPTYYKKEKNSNFIKKTVKVKKIKKSKYQKLIDSPEWENRKKRYYEIHLKKCDICGTKKKIHLHHLSYRDVVNAFDYELVPLCNSHHKEFHKRYKTKKRMFAEYKEFKETFVSYIFLS